MKNKGKFQAKFNFHSFDEIPLRVNKHSLKSQRLEKKTHKAPFKYIDMILELIL